MITDDKDQLLRFIFEDLGIRGEIVTLDASWQAALTNHNYPATVADQLGQALATSVLLSATLKFKGSLILQVQGNGPISMLVAQADEQQTVRGLAHWNGDISPGNLSQLFGDGRLVLTIKPDQGNAYQGIVNIEGELFSEMIEAYFKQSEQLKTRLWFAVDGHKAVGLLLQELPAHQGEQADWERIEMLADTIKRDELLTISSTDIIHRLFHEETVRLYEPQPIRFECSCSKEKIEANILTFGLEDMMSLIQEKGAVDVDCDFCNKHYHFDSIDIKQIFSVGTSSKSNLIH